MKMAWERRHLCLHAFIYCGQDGRAPGYIFMIMCERALMVSDPKINPGAQASLPAIRDAFSLLLSLYPDVSTLSHLSQKIHQRKKSSRLHQGKCDYGPQEKHAAQNPFPV
jgi:hypothetical protein